MPVIEINRNPSRRELLVFGGLLLLFAALVGALLQWKTHAPGAARAVWLIGAVLVAAYLAIPPMRRPTYIAWMYAVYPIGFVVSHILLGLVYYGIVTPTGLLLRLAGRDPMTRRFDKGSASYWVEHDPHHEPQRYFRQY